VVLVGVAGSQRPELWAGARRRAARGSVARSARTLTAGCALAAVAVAWPGSSAAPGARPQGGRVGPPAVARFLPGARPALAWSEWCDSDPLLLIRTPSGRIVPVFYLTGVYGERYLVAGLLGNLSATYSVDAVETAAGPATAVELQVTVPDGLLFGGRSFPTRVLVSQGPAGSLAVYGSATGESGAPMTVRFTLDVP